MNYPTHIIAVGGFITNYQGEVLMIKSPLRGWDFPGGIVEVGETLIEGLKREVKEETGIDIIVMEMVGIYSNIQQQINQHGPVPTILNIDFWGKAISGELATSSESIEAGWFERSELLDMVSNPLIFDRLKLMLDYNGKKIYRAFSKNPYQVHEECNL